MINEKDNDQFTNNQLTKGKDRADRLYHAHYFGHWSLSSFLVIGIWSLVIIFFPGHWLLSLLNLLQELLHGLIMYLIEATDAFAA